MAGTEALGIEALGIEALGIEALGIVAIIIMVGSYAAEKRAPIFIASFAFGCALAAFYAFLIESYPFLIAEGLWAIIAARRWWLVRSDKLL